MQMPQADEEESLTVMVHYISLLVLFPCNKQSSKPAQSSPLCFYLIAELERKFLFVLQQLIVFFDVTSYLCHVIRNKGLGR